jgi:hypothetical protein
MTLQSIIFKVHKGVIQEANVTSPFPELSDTLSIAAAGSRYSKVELETRFASHASSPSLNLLDAYLSVTEWIMSNMPE